MSGVNPAGSGDFATAQRATVVQMQGGVPGDSASVVKFVGRKGLEADILKVLCVAVHSDFNSTSHHIHSGHSLQQRVCENIG